MLKIQNLTKMYSETAGVRDVSFDVKPGTLTALIGPSGSGKTTCLKALAMLNAPDAGEIEMDGVTYKFPLGQNEQLLPKPWPKMTAVFQQLFLWPHMTLRENILLPVPKGEDISAELDELIDLFDMAHFIDRYPNEASGGQKQRVALARALILKPSYILLDEVTSALDVEQAAKVLTCLEKLKERGIGIFLVTHLLNFAERAADQVLFMDEGKVIEAGDASIISTPKTERMKKFISVIQTVS